MSKVHSYIKLLHLLDPMEDKNKTNQKKTHSTQQSF